VVKKREVSNAAKLSVFESIFVPILTFGHGSWVMIERMLSQVQAAEKGSMQRVNCVAPVDKVRSCEIRGALNVESFLRIGRSQLRWLGHVFRMSQEKWRGKSCWLHVRESGQEVVQGSGRGTKSPNFLGPVFVWMQL